MLLLCWAMMLPFLFCRNAADIVSSFTDAVNFVIAVAPRNLMPTFRFSAAMRRYILSTSSPWDRISLATQKFRPVSKITACHLEVLIQWHCGRLPLCYVRTPVSLSTWAVSGRYRSNLEILLSRAQEVDSRMVFDVENRLRKPTQLIGSDRFILLCLRYMGTHPEMCNRPCCDSAFMDVVCFLLYAGLVQKPKNL